ncbi:hypothetical protein [Cylindrospermum sp. FACHB-282]|uniref:hypothetical protein n=1 Tax=Cylindrospermum sp. FACHB-282 TaxID=2692794 RepID=UPI0016880431|nr:hypothetical protein [Cylindrospermum sp. FACHB-282]MBD2385187.1 hypothetical protein [Cylindrospermum sp. FACHB-282]
MNKLVISDLHPTDVETFLSDLDPAQMKTLLGGFLSDQYRNARILTIHGDINSKSTTYEGAGNSHDNKIHTVDYSRSTYIWYRSWD